MPATKQSGDREEAAAENRQFRRADFRYLEKTDPCRRFQGQPMTIGAGDQRAGTKLSRTRREVFADIQSKQFSKRICVVSNDLIGRAVHPVKDVQDRIEGDPAIEPVEAVDEIKVGRRVQGSWTAKGSESDEAAVTIHRATGTIEKGAGTRARAEGIIGGVVSENRSTGNI